MRVLLFSPMFYGHPVVYARVLSRLLLFRGCTVVLASYGLKDFSSQQWPEVDVIEGGRFLVCDLGGSISPVAGDMSAETLRDLQASCAAEVTVFLHADYFRREFERIISGACGSLTGRTVGIFSITAAWFPGEDNVTGERLRLVGPTIRRTLGNIKRRIFNFRESDRHFFESLLRRPHVLTRMVVKDERVATHLGKRVHWMPEIYRVFDERPTKKGADQFDRVVSSYGRFLAAHADSTVLLYFGNAAWYKGYDYALDLAVKDPSVVFVHCGAPELHDGKYDLDVAGLRNTLIAQDRLFETGEFLHSQRLIEHFFASAERVVSTHRLAGTSGTLLQAVESGKPILTPDSGLLGHRTKQHGLGLVYEHGNPSSLWEQWTRFRSIPVEPFEDALRRFSMKFSEQALGEFVDTCLLGGGA